MAPNWLPELILFETHGGDWEKYVDALHAAFTKDFCSGNFLYDGKEVRLKRHPVEQGKEATFWHIISDGKSESDREINLRRCERVSWPRAILDNCTDSCLKIWTEEVRGDTRIHIWCPSAEYLVVLADRGHYVLPWTAYPVERPHQQRKLEQRWKKATGG
jgi:hypothetical protein